MTYADAFIWTFITVVSVGFLSLIVWGMIIDSAWRQVILPPIIACALIALAALPVWLIAR